MGMKLIERREPKKDWEQGLLCYSFDCDKKAEYVWVLWPGNSLYLCVDCDREQLIHFAEINIAGKAAMR